MVGGWMVDIRSAMNSIYEQSIFMTRNFPSSTCLHFVCRFVLNDDEFLRVFRFVGGIDSSIYSNKKLRITILGLTTNLGHSLSRWYKQKLKITLETSRY